MTIQKTCKQLNILDRMRRVLCYRIVFKLYYSIVFIVCHSRKPTSHWRKAKKRLIVEHQNNIDSWGTQLLIY